MLTYQVLALPATALAGLVAAFFRGGLDKGIIGVGLPLVLVPLAAQFISVQAAVALVSVSMVASNVTQAADGGQTIQTIQRASAGDDRPARVSDRARAVFLFPAALLAAMPRVRLQARTTRWAGPAIGLAAGVLGGMSAMFGPPTIAYLIGVRADPQTFVKHMAIFAFTASVTMLVALGGTGTLSGTDLLISVVAVIPIQFGMPAGRWLRRRIDSALFRFGVLIVLAAGGIDLLHHALF